VSGPAPLPDWPQLAEVIPQVTVPMRRYLEQIACVLRPGSVSGADLALRSFAAFLAQTSPPPASLTHLTRRHIEDFKPWLAARPGQNKPAVTPATIAHRLGTLRMFFLRIAEWGWEEAPPRVPMFPGDLPRLDRIYIRAKTRFLEVRLGASVSQVDEAIELARSAAAATVRPAGLSAAHFRMGQAYRARYDARGSLDDLTWSLRAMRQAVEEDPGQDRGSRLYLLANTLLEVVEILKPGEEPAADHLKLVEQWLREARPLLNAKDAAMCQASLGLALLQRARHFGSGKDLGAALDNLVAGS
jgi:hypothetical protein